MPSKKRPRNGGIPMIDRVRIGVMGSASGPTLENPDYLKKAYELGRYIALADCILINGACPGLPDEAARGARLENGFVFGVSPAYSKQEHEREYHSPVHHDFILYTGVGFMERDIINIRSADAIIIIGGGVGSLNEFTIAYDEQRPIGILSQTGGISDHIPEILKICDRDVTEGIAIESDPKKLIQQIISLVKKYPYPVHEDSRVKDAKGVFIRRG